MWLVDKFKEGIADMKFRAKEDQADQMLTLVVCDYIGGLRGYRGSTIRIRSKYGDNRLMAGKKYKLKEYEVLGLSWEEDAERSLGKAVAGAVVGGALTGGAGALVGGAIGGRKKDKSRAVIRLKKLDSDEVMDVIVKANEKQYKKLNKIVY
ncbi:MAG: Uncharacterized protein AWU54_450 [Candidatus Frackibacter sp. T328-2]|nr:MAG: Uncharacterized protein AWU54_450 [Candidatus Frackibacter sp. T328-2]